MDATQSLWKKVIVILAAIAIFIIMTISCSIGLQRVH